MDLIDSDDFIRRMASRMAFLAAFEEHQIEDTDQFDDPSQDQDETQPSDHLPLKLSPFFDSGSLSDITLMVGSSVFHAHKLILSSWSPVFKEIILKRSNSDEPHVLEDDQEYEVMFSDFLKFMYTETIEISKDTVYSFLKLSKKYKVDEICELCEEFLIGEVSNDTIALQTLTDAEEFGLTKVYDHCFKFLETNFFQLSDSSLKKMSPSLFLKMLESSDLVVLSERHLFNQAVDWLYTGGHDYHKYTKEVISKIHFTHMSSLDLSSLKRGIQTPTVVSDRKLQIQSSLNDSGLQDSIHDAFEWKALVSEEKELSLLPCDTKSTLSKKHCVEPRICISGPVSSNYQHLSLSEKKPNVLSVLVTSVSAYDTLLDESRLWWVIGSKCFNAKSKKWEISYQLKPNQNHIGGTYRLVILTRVRPHMNPIVTTSEGVVTETEVKVEQVLHHAKVNQELGSVEIKVVVMVRNSHRFWDHLQMPKEPIYVDSEIEVRLSDFWPMNYENDPELFLNPW